MWHLAGFRLADGSPRLVAATDHGVSTWDPASGERIAAFEVDAGVNDIVVCRVSAEEPVVAVASEQGIQWFDPVTGARRCGAGTDDTVWGLAVGTGRGDGETVYGAGYMGPHPSHRWDSSTGSMMPDLGGHDDHITAVAVLVLPDGRLLLASADSAGEVRRWDVLTGEPIGAPIRAHPSAVTVLAIIAQPRPQLLTSGTDEVIRRWDAVSGELLDEVAEGFDPVLLTVGGAPTLAVGGSRGLTMHPFRL